MSQASHHSRVQMKEGCWIYSSPHLGKCQQVSPTFKHVMIIYYIWDYTACQIKTWSPPSERWERNGSQNRGLGKWWGCPMLATPCSTQRVPKKYLSKILCGCIRLLKTWVMWSWAAATSGGGLYLFTAATFSRIRNAKGKEKKFVLKGRQALDFL